MAAQIRKLVRYVEQIRIEGGRAVATPIDMIGVAAVIRNPWAGKGFVSNLRPQILAVAPGLGRELTDAIVALAGGGDRIEAYGKAAVVGMNGEIEHASALIHTLRFGNQYREAVGAESYLSFSNTRGGPDCAISIPMMHKHDAGKRSHYITLQFSIGDAPGADEIVVALGAATGGRGHPRIGDRYLDLKEIAAAEAAKAKPRSNTRPRAAAGAAKRRRTALDA